MTQLRPVKVIDGRHQSMRFAHEHPLSSCCRPHLRVICGTCRHHAGENIRERATCTKLGGQRNGLADASACGSWGRK